MCNTVSVLSCVLRKLLLCFTGACWWDWHCRLSGIEGENRFSCSHASNARRHYVPSGIPLIHFSASVSACLLSFVFFFFPCWEKCTENTPHHCIIAFSKSLFFIYLDLRSIKGQQVTVSPLSPQLWSSYSGFGLKRKMKGHKKHIRVVPLLFYFTHHLFWFAIVKVCRNY